MLGCLRTSRLASVQGLPGRFNDLIYCPPLQRTPSSLLVFFGGDVQNYKEVMEKYRGNCKYLKWNLESVAELLSGRFPSSHVMVVMPSRVELGVFSCYDHFVAGDQTGSPMHDPGHQALQHLHLLLQQTALQGLHEEGVDCYLMGFSKGCVVLNQMVYEVEMALRTAGTPEARDVPGLLARLRRFYWLDGGHSGSQNAWVTSHSALTALTSLGAEIHVDVTPYQVRDPRRPWIREEEEAFVQTLSTIGARIRRRLHFQDFPPSLDNHFNLLQHFGQS